MITAFICRVDSLSMEVWSVIYRFAFVVIRITMMTSSNGNIFRVTGPLCGEFTGPGEFPTQRPVTRSFDVFFDVRLNKRLSKHSSGWWFETLSWSLWRHHNAQSFHQWLLRVYKCNCLKPLEWYQSIYWTITLYRIKHYITMRCW